MYLSGFECQFSDVSVTNLNGVQDCYVYIVTHCVPPYGGGGYQWCNAFRSHGQYPSDNSHVPVRVIMFNFFIGR